LAIMRLPSNKRKTRKDDDGNGSDS